MRRTRALITLAALPLLAGCQAGAQAQESPSRETQVQSIPVTPSASVSSAASTTPTPSATSPSAPTAHAKPSVDKSWPKNPPWDACPAPTWPATTHPGDPGDGRRILVIGDSLTRESRVDTAKGLRATGWTPTFRCWGSTRLDWGLEQVARAKKLHQLPDWVVIALGTNDISWETQATTEARMNRLLDKVGPDRQVMWVDLHLTRSAWLDARADWFNGVVNRLARKHPNLTVVHWHKVATKAGIRGFDGIHYSDSGYRLRARTVVERINAQARRLGQ